MTVNPVWRDLEEYYAEDDRRAMSAEADLPGSWYMDDWDPRYRLTWVHATGELIAVADHPIAPAPLGRPAGEPGRRTELLAWAETEQAARGLLRGWEGQSGKLKGYYWLRGRARRADVTAVPGDQVTDEHRRLAHERTGSLF